MADALEVQNVQNAIGVMGVGQAKEGQRVQRQWRLGEDVKNLGTSAATTMSRNLGSLREAKNTFAGSFQQNQALDFGKKSVWDSYKLNFDQVMRQDEDNRIKELTSAYGQAASFKSAADDLEAQVKGLRG